MNIRFPKISFPFFERNKKGDSFYEIKQFSKWGLINGTNLQIAQNHPILTPAMLFLAKLFSQAEFYVKNKKTGEKIYDHWVLDLLNKPNFYQTRHDFLETLNFTQIAEGKAVGWIRRTTGISIPTSIYLLDPNKIEWPDDFTTPLSKSNKSNPIQNKEIIYDRDGENEKIKIKDLLFWYDLPNGLNSENLFENKSRITGLRQTLLNTFDSLVAKNIILKTNGKELISGGSSGASGTTFPLTPGEKKDAELLVQDAYGLSFSRKRGLVTNANLKWQSMHIAVRDLGLDESVKVDGNIIFTALHIPKDIISLEAKKTTYNNFKESMVSFIQNEMQPSINAFLTPINSILDDNDLEVIGDYNSMPIMKFVLIEKYDGIMKRGLALLSLRNAGLPDEIALVECDFDKNIKLNPLIQVQQDEGKKNDNGEGEK